MLETGTIMTEIMWRAIARKPKNKVKSSIIQKKAYRNIKTSSERTYRKHIIKW